jgi:hypothetical protein
LSEATLAFGPFYLCSGAQAGPSCDTALGEWKDSRALDLLRTAPVTLGELSGYGGRALSYMHDCGIVSLLTQDEPLVLAAAEEQGGHSVVLVGAAEPTVSGAPRVPFRIELDIASSNQADRGQPVVRSSPGQFDAAIDGDTTSLTVAFDAGAWLTEVNPSTFWQDAACAPDGPPTVCAGTVSQDCEVDVSVDCAEQDQICAPNIGCQDAIAIDQGSAAGRAVAQAITLTVGLEVRVE